MTEKGNLNIEPPLHKSFNHLGFNIIKLYIFYTRCVCTKIGAMPYLFLQSFPGKLNLLHQGQHQLGLISKDTSLSRVLGNMCFRLQALNGTDQQQFIMAP